MGPINLNPSSPIFPVPLPQDEENLQDESQEQTSEQLQEHLQLQQQTQQTQQTQPTCSVPVSKNQNSGKAGAT